MSTEAGEAFQPTPIAQVFARGSAVTESAEQGNPEAPKDDKPSKEAAASSAAQAPNGKESKAKEEAKTESDAKEVEAKERTRDDKGRFKTDADERLAKAEKAIVAERKKRQELERQLQERGKEEKPKKDFFADPEGALNERDAKLRAENDERFFAMCEDAAKESHEDYDTLVSQLLEDCESDKALAARTFTEMRSSRNPAEFLYRSAKLHVEMKAVGGDLGKYRESVEKPLRDELAARDAKIKDLETQLAQLGKVPSSLSQEQSSSRASVEVEAITPMPLDDIVKPRKRRA